MCFCVFVEQFGRVAKVTDPFVDVVVMVLAAMIPGAINCVQVFPSDQVFGNIFQVLQTCRRPQRFPALSGVAPINVNVDNASGDCIDH